ncbi:hypothetical protein B0H13DRAFT_1862435 [Mycena leptocephala]|nr:hypothetical protein B0H13DRAFT_1862435 [Mycena leptocephala]
MADLVGLVASILQLVEIAVQARDYIKGFRNAPQEQQKLLSEIQRVEILVKQLHSRIENCQFAELLGGMQQFREPLVQMKETLERLTRKLSSTGAISKVSSRLSWPLWGKEEIYEGLGTIERFKSFLALWLGMDIWFVTSKTFHEHRSLTK